jgi:hypothetical protein
MKAKKAIMLIFTLAILISTLAVPASAANSNDTTYTYNWSGYQRYDYTPARYKTDNTYVYIKNQYGTLPLNGYYVSTFYGTSSTAVTNKASADQYLLNDYSSHTIRPTGTYVPQANKYVKIRGYYPLSSYSWGNSTIAWSPDTSNQWNYPSLN